MTFRNRFVALAALGLAGLAGCSGGEKEDDAIVVVPDGSKVATAGTAAGGGSSGGSTEGAAPSDSGGAAAKPAAVEGWGTLKGRVVFEGEVPKPEVLVPKNAPPDKFKDAEICSAEEIESQKLVVDPETKGVKWAIVYIPKPTAVNPEAESAARAEPVVFDQEHCVFEPHVLGVMQGNKVIIKSADKAGHNVHTQLRNTAFNGAIQPGTEVPLTISNPDNRPGAVICDIHNWMKAWWLTLNNPYFAVTNDKGEYEIKLVPAGEQKVVVWAEATNPGFVTASGSGDPVTIPADGVAEQNYTIKASQVK
jgi:plastocyanin